MSNEEEGSFSFKEKLQDNLFSYMFSLLLGGIITILIFFLSSHPVTPEEVKQELLNTSIDEFKNQYGGNISGGNIDKIFSSELNASADKSVVLVGSINSGEKLYRWISIFERGSPNVIDKVVGRSGFFELTSFASFKAPYFNSLVVEKIETMDLDKDGSLELHFRLQSTWADSTSVGPLIYTKKSNGEWHIDSLPSISEAISSPLKNTKFRARHPYTFFGMVGEDDTNPKPTNELKELEISEELWSLNHNGKTQNFITLRNGGDYFFKNHIIKGYSQIQSLSFFIDGGAILGPHYAVINMFRFGDNGVVIDELWNWEHPMYSSRPLRLLEIEMDSIYKAGIQAHIAGDVFYGYTEFEKIRVQQ